MRERAARWSKEAKNKGGTETGFQTDSKMRGSHACGNPVWQVNICSDGYDIKLTGAQILILGRGNLRRFTRSYEFIFEHVRRH